MEETKIYFSLRETEQETGVPASTLRYWEKQFELLNPRKDGHGNRYYTRADQEIIKRIKYIRDELKITRVEAIRKELASNTKHSDERQAALEASDDPDELELRFRGIRRGGGGSSVESSVQRVSEITINSPLLVTHRSLTSPFASITVCPSLLMRTMVPPSRRIPTSFEEEETAMIFLPFNTSSELFISSKTIPLDVLNTEPFSINRYI